MSEITIFHRYGQFFESKILERANLLQDELRTALNSSEDIKALKAKATSLIESLQH